MADQVVRPHHRPGAPPRPNKAVFRSNISGNRLLRRNRSKNRSYCPEKPGNPRLPEGLGIDFGLVRASAPPRASISPDFGLIGPAPTGPLTKRASSGYARSWGHARSSGHARSWEQRDAGQGNDGRQRASTESPGDRKKPWETRKAREGHEPEEPQERERHVGDPQPTCRSGYQDDRR